MLKKEDVIRYSAGIHFSQERLFNAFLREKGIKNISISKFRVLEVLWKNKEEGIVFSGICQETDLAKSTVSIMLSNMEEQGLIYRVAQGTDIQNVLFYPTEEGCKYKNEYYEIMDKIYEIIYEGVSEEEKEVYEKVLTTITENYKKRIYKKKRK
ncbi:MULTISPECIES: MarR family winged helix-turn-helix transcriptional regulator [Peptacetobacter]|uniref:Transcriptional regulator, MarR family n=1 Tax=Peptacetobacter hiranonis (strain DSM 13275 / JCM 10541 / KCTC 15199 / TO-931) TaxID=500633 RepID=B6FZI8_PEPHT|nr:MULTISPECIES: MarR family transcriptional regulator [Peptacetobacter]EEA85059.1 transcriptional regulator, MarR family [Peptacetobacter hiranonis DSM 13275]MEE0451911.1 hypothetical protein [Peptacetobacter sp.]QEK20924.1 hypothetical protein KGNDJEFE_01411 [Peptacetobacter hiranonis]